MNLPQLNGHAPPSVSLRPLRRPPVSVLPERKESASLAAVKWARALTLWRESKPTGRMKVDHFAKAVLLDLAHRAKADPDRSDAIICFPSCQTVADMLGVSKDSVDRALHRLREAKLIESEFRYDKRGKRTSNTYILKVGTMPLAAAKSDTSLSRSQRSTKPLPAVDYAAGSGGTYEGSSEGSSEEERKSSSSAAFSESGQPTDRADKTKNRRLAQERPSKPADKELTREKAGTKGQEQQAASSQQAGQKESSDAAFDSECQAAIQSLARTMEWFGRHDSHPLGADENLACAKEVLRSAYDRHGADIVGLAERQFVATYCRAEGGPGAYLMEICERLNPRPRREEQQRANSFEACGPAINKLGSALKAAGHSLDGKELIRSAHARWGKHLACGGADRLADALAGDKPVHSPQALLDAICKRLKEEGWKPMGRSRLDELMGDCGPSLW